MAEKLLSIIIPTKDREYYCKKVLDYMLTFNDERIEFVVQNNGQSDELDEYVKEKDDKRVVYKHVYEPLCQVDNSDQSIALSSGQYLCFIGDDDIVLPNIMQYVEYAIKYSIDNIAQRNPVGYIWPSDRCPTGRMKFIPLVENKEFILNQEHCINKYIRNGCCKNPKDFRLPVLYHGITRRQCIEDVKKETGHYVGGASPDSYTSVALAKYVKKQLIVNSNFTIAGSCPQSATALNLIGGHCGHLEDAPHLKNRGDYVWDYMIPKYYSVQTIWAESAITALRETNNTNAEKINLKELFCMAYVSNVSIRALIIKQTEINLSENNRNKAIFWVACFFKIIFKNIANLYSINLERIRRVLKLSKVKTILNLMDIRDCVNYIN